MFKSTSKLIATILLCSVALYAPAQSGDPSGGTFEESVLGYFQAVEKMPQEKLYLHLDKPFYGAGEKIWFGGYLVNAITHAEDSLSNFVNVELLNRQDSIILRRKFRRDSLGLRGNILLPAELPAGDYSLRAYSNWMRNAGTAFFYQRNLQIGNSIATDIQPSVGFQSAADAKSAPLAIRFANAADEPYPDIKVSYKIWSRSLKPVSGTAKTGPDGSITVAEVPVSPEDVFVDVRFEDNKYDYGHTFTLPAVASDYNVAFFPEGGNLLSGVLQNVAFKAQADDGLSLPVGGCVTNQRGDTVALLASEHDGMGVLAFTPVAGDAYKAEVRSEKGLTRQFPLPEVRDSGVALAMAVRNGSVFYQVHKAGPAPWPDSLYLVAHTRGSLQVLTPLPEEKASGRIDGSAFPDGISHFLLVDGRGMPLSERLLFFYNPGRTVWTVEPDKGSYKKRESVSLRMGLKDRAGQPLCGRFSVSVTDNRSVPQDSLYDNILSNLLLTSDLKGVVEHPGYYFSDPGNPAVQRHLDMVMMTHGWRRFKTDSLTVAPVFDIRHYIEVGQTVSGRVRSSAGKGIEGASIILYSPDCFMGKESGADGRFLVDSIQFRDSTDIVVSAKKKGNPALELEIDPETFPEAGHKEPFGNRPWPGTERYLAQTRDTYYNEGGMRVVHLKEVVVSGQKKRKSTYVSMAEQTVTSDQIPQTMKHRSAYDYVLTMAGVARTSDGLSIRGNPTPPLILIDDVPQNISGGTVADILGLINMEEVASISIIKGAGTAFFGTKAGGGAISIMRHDGSQPLPVQPEPGVKLIRPQGYNQIAEFYVPAYDTPEKQASQTPDQRTTIYWNPSLRLGADGQATMKFDASDDPGSYHVTVEGITDDGTVCRYSGEMTR